MDNVPEVVSSCLPRHIIEGELTAEFRKIYCAAFRGGLTAPAANRMMGAEHRG